jgi:hypothetical protein
MPLNWCGHNLSDLFCWNELGTMKYLPPTVAAKEVIQGD